MLGMTGNNRPLGAGMFNWQYRHCSIGISANIIGVFRSVVCSEQSEFDKHGYILSCMQATAKA
jgi:hypothetical protein